MCVSLESCKVRSPPALSTVYTSRLHRLVVSKETYLIVSPRLVHSINNKSVRGTVVYSLPTPAPTSSIGQTKRNGVRYHQLSSHRNTTLVKSTLFFYQAQHTSYIQYHVRRHNPRSGLWRRSLPLQNSPHRPSRRHSLPTTQGLLQKGLTVPPRQTGHLHIISRANGASKGKVPSDITRLYNLV